MYYYYYCKRKSIRTYLRQSDCLMLMMKRSFTYLLTFLWLSWIQSVNKWKSLIAQNLKYSSSNLHESCFSANELIFAEYCEFHACRKREGKSDYQRKYRVFGDTGKSDSYFRCDGFLGPEFRLGKIAMSSDWCSYRFKSIEHLLKLIFGLVVSSDVGSTRLVKSSNCLWC